MSHSLKEAILPCRHDHKPISHQHAHSPEEHHHHALELKIHRPQQRRALFLSIVLTSLMMLIEFVAGLLTGSLMLMSDAIICFPTRRRLE